MYVKKTKLDFETAVRPYNNGVGRKSSAGLLIILRATTADVTPDESKTHDNPAFDQKGKKKKKNRTFKMPRV